MFKYKTLFAVIAIFCFTLLTACFDKGFRANNGGSGGIVPQAVIEESVQTPVAQLTRAEEIMDIFFNELDSYSDAQIQSVQNSLLAAEMSMTIGFSGMSSDIINMTVRLHDDCGSVHTISTNAVRWNDLSGLGVRPLGSAGGYNARVLCEDNTCQNAVLAITDAVGMTLIAMDQAQTSSVGNTITYNYEPRRNLENTAYDSYILRASSFANLCSDIEDDFMNQPAGTGTTVNMTSNPYDTTSNTVQGGWSQPNSGPQ